MKETEYLLKITVKHDRLTSSALEVVPKIIRTFARELKAKTMLLSGESGVTMDCDVQEFTASSYESYKMELKDEA